MAVIPAYNESQTIGDVITRAEEYVDDVVVVDDASTDDTGEIARKHGVTVITHIFNTGVGGALRTGYRYALHRNYDYVVQIDGDGQHDPSYIPMLFDALEDSDIIIGSRYLNDSFEQFPLIRKVGIRFFTKVVNVLGGIDISDVTSGYRAYRTPVLGEILHTSDQHWAVEQTLEAARQGYRYREVHMNMPTREQGDSQFDVRTMVLYPPRMASIILRVLLFR